MQSVGRKARNGGRADIYINIRRPGSYDEGGVWCSVGMLYRSIDRGCGRGGWFGRAGGDWLPLFLMVGGSL